MILVVGLGNIGRQYKDTPHNAGFEFLNEFRNLLISKDFVADLWKNENTFQSEICKVRKGNEIEYMLAKPTTYMNLSGSAVSKIVSKYNPERVVIVHDDLDIKIGEYKIQVGKGPKDHNGVSSVEKIKGSEQYLRVRLGVEGRVDKKLIPGDIYVIKRMDKVQLLQLSDAISESCIELFDHLNQGI